MAASSGEAVAEIELQPPAFGLAGRGVVGAVISSFLFGYSICVVNSCLALIAVVFEWCGNEWQADCGESLSRQGLANASLYLGAAFGAILSGRQWIAGLGSRKQLVLSGFHFVVGAVACGFAQGVVALTFGRFASGVGLGLSAIAGPVYIAEVSPRERRGANAAMHGVFITLGILASIALGIPQSPPPADAEQPIGGLDVWYWRFLLGLPIVLALVQAVLLLWAYPTDPPSFLVQRGEMDAARSVLYQIYGMPVAQRVDLKHKAQAALALQLQDLQEAVTLAKEVPRIRVVQAIFDPFFRMAVFLGVGLAAFQQLCGINGLMSYSNALFAQAGIPPESLNLASTMMATANVCASLLSSRVVDRWGRRKLLLTGSFCQTVAMLCLNLSSDERYNGFLSEAGRGIMSVVCFTIFVMSFSFGLGAVTWLYLSEIYPMEIRGASLSACGVINWLSSFLVVFGTRFLSLQGACHVFGLICLLGFVGTYIWIVETKGCSMEDSPLTPRSERGSSHLLSNTSSPRGKYQKMQDASDDEDASIGSVSAS